MTLPAKRKAVKMSLSRKSTSSNKSSGDKDRASEHLFGAKSNAKNRLTVHKNEPCKGLLKDQVSVSKLLTNLVLNTNDNKENDFLSVEDFRNKPDLWMAAFDNPMEFIQYCRKRMDHERSLMEKSRKVENDILHLLERWEENTGRHAEILQDLFKVQGINDKLQEVIMEERTHCQHLIGVNDQLETQRRIMARKYQAALLLGKVDEKSVEHLLEKDPKVVPLADQVTDLREKIKKCDTKQKKRLECTDPVILADKVKRLEEYIHDLKKQHREEATVLKDTIQKYDLKFEAMVTQYQDLLKRNGQSFEELKESLSILMNENMHLRHELLKKEDKFLQVQMDEIKAVTRKRPSRLTTSVDEISEAFEECTAIEKELKLRLARTEIELVDKSNLVRDTMAKIIMLERKCAQLEQDNLFLHKSHEHCIGVLKSRNEVLEKRCEKSEERRRLDNAGFREDVRELRNLLKTMNKNVQKMIRYNSELQLETDDVHVKASDRDLEGILQKKQSADSFKSWLKQANPKKSQQALSIWSDFIERKLDKLEGRINNAKKQEELVVLFDNRDKMKSSKGHIPTHDWESSGTDYNDLPSMSN